eukprot:TRINITY_DN10_c0_g1_i3.p1 TRINITY_DN10_c0_g1~~TRINITY_DN10_c0_g1_i3.p1  ORF type:complete len:973 (-),score=203.60 TRINITY_DN10_c0_g1_i3:71-2944(-)
MDPLTQQPQPVALPPSHVESYQARPTSLVAGIVLSALSTVAYWAALVNNSWTADGAPKNSRQSGLLEYCACRNFDVHGDINDGKHKIEYFSSSGNRSQWNAIRVMAVMTFVFAFLSAVIAMIGRGKNKAPLYLNILAVIFGLIVALMYTDLFGLEYAGGSFIIFILGFGWAGLGAIGTLQGQGKLRDFGHVFHVLTLAFLAVALSTSWWTYRSIDDTPYGGANPADAEGRADIIRGPRLFPEGNPANQVQFGRGLWEVCRCAGIEDNCHVEDGPTLFKKEKCDEFDSVRGLAYIAGLLMLYVTYLVALYTSGSDGRLVKQAGLVSVFASALAAIATGLYAHLVNNDRLSEAYGCFIFGWALAFVAGIFFLNASKAVPVAPLTAPKLDTINGQRVLVLTLSAALLWLAQSSFKWLENLKQFGLDSDHLEWSSAGTRGLYDFCTCKTVDAYCQIDSVHRIFNQGTECYIFNISRILMIVAWIFAMITAFLFYCRSRIHPSIGTFSVVSVALAIAGSILFASQYRDKSLSWSFALYIVAIFNTAMVAAGVFFHQKKPFLKTFASAFMTLSLVFYIIAIGGGQWYERVLTQSAVRELLPADADIGLVFPNTYVFLDGTHQVNSNNARVTFTRSLFDVCQCLEYNMKCEGEVPYVIKPNNEHHKHGKFGIGNTEKLYKNKECRSTMAVRALGIIAAFLMTFAAWISTRSFGNSESYEPRFNRLITGLAGLAALIGIVATIIFAEGVNRGKRSNTSSGYAIFIGGWALAAIGAWLSTKVRAPKVIPQPEVPLAPIPAPAPAPIPEPVYERQPEPIAPVIPVPEPQPEPVYVAPVPVPAPAPVYVHPFDMDNEGLADYLGGVIAQATTKVGLTGPKLLDTEYSDVETALGGHIARNIYKAKSRPDQRSAIAAMDNDALAVFLGTSVAGAVRSHKLTGPILKQTSDDDIQDALGSRAADEIRRLR